MKIERDYEFRDLIYGGLKDRRDKEAALAALLDYLARRKGVIRESSHSERAAMLGGAIASDDVRLLKPVLEHGLSVDAKINGSVVAFKAFRQGQVAVAQELIEAGFSTFSDDSTTLLESSIRSHDPDMLRLVFDRYPLDRLRASCEVGEIALAFLEVEDEDLERSGVARSMECLEVLQDHGVIVDASWLARVRAMFTRGGALNADLTHRDDAEREMIKASTASRLERRRDFIDAVFDRLSQLLTDDAAMVAKLRGQGVLCGCLELGMTRRAEWLIDHGLSKHDTMRHGATWLGHVLESIRMQLSYNDIVADAGWRAAIRHGVALGVDVNRRLNSGQTPMTQFVSAMMENKHHHSNAFPGLGELLQELVSMGFDVNARDVTGLTPLQMAARRPDSTLVLMLLELGAEASLPAPDGRPLLNAYLTASHEKSLDSHHWVQRGGLTFDGTIERLVQEGGLDPNAKSPMGLAPLHENASSIAVRTLLHMGADPNLHCDNMGWTPLQYVVRSGRHTTGCVELLLDAGGDVFLPDREGVSLADQAKEMGLRESVLNIVMSEIVARTGELQDFVYANGDRILHRAAACGEHWCLSRMKDAWSDIDVTDADGYSALHRVVMRGDEIGTRLLLEMGADVNLPAPNGARPIHMAVSKEYTEEPQLEVLKLLISHGADGQARFKGKSITSMRRDPEVARLLRSVSMGSSIEAVFRDDDREADSPATEVSMSSMGGFVL